MPFLTSCIVVLEEIGGFDGHVDGIQVVELEGEVYRSTSLAGFFIA